MRGMTRRWRPSFLHLGWYDLSRAMVYAIVIPVYNAAAALPELDARLQRSAPGVTVLAVDDGSTDDTGQTLQRLGIRHVCHAYNRGKGEALKTGFAEILKEPVDAVVQLDADLQHEPEYLPQFFAAFEADRGDVLIGTRDFHAGAMPFHRRMTNRVTSWAITRLTGTLVSDSQSGYRLIGRRVLETIHPQAGKFDYESEFLILTIRAGFTVGTVPVSTVYHGESSFIRPWRDTVHFVMLMTKFWRRT